MSEENKQPYSNKISVFIWGSTDDLEGDVIISITQGKDIAEISLSVASARILAVALKEAAELAETPTIVKEGEKLDPHYATFHIDIDCDRPETTVGV